METESDVQIIKEKPHWKATLFCITPTSKYLALSLFIILPFLGGYIGYMYAPERVVEVERIVVKAADDKHFVQNESVHKHAFEIGQRSVNYRIYPGDTTLKLDLPDCSYEIAEEVMKEATFPYQIYKNGDDEIVCYHNYLTEITTPFKPLLMYYRGELSNVQANDNDLIYQESKTQNWALSARGVYQDGKLISSTTTEIEPSFADVLSLRRGEGMYFKYAGEVFFIVNDWYAYGDSLAFYSLPDVGPDIVDLGNGYGKDQDQIWYGTEPLVRDADFILHEINFSSMGNNYSDDFLGISPVSNKVFFQGKELEGLKADLVKILKNKKGTLYFSDGNTMFFPSYGCHGPKEAYLTSSDRVEDIVPGC